jgi:hypothetical protein
LAHLVTLRRSIRASITILEALLDRFPPFEGEPTLEPMETFGVKALDLATGLAAVELAKMWAKVHHHPPT